MSCTLVYLDERSANFGFDKPFDPNNLGSIWEGAGESSQTAANLLGARTLASKQAFHHIYQISYIYIYVFMYSCIYVYIYVSIY